MFFLKELPTQQMIDSYVCATGIGSSGDISEALSMMRKASQLVRLLDLYFQEHNISQLKFLILVVIDREPEKTSLRQSEINARLDVSKPVLHRTVISLLENDLLVRSNDELDKRAHLLSLTMKGSLLLKNIMPGYFKIIDDFMRKYP